ncbi:MAG: nucleoside deaminase, partial [Saprospiraceae bacterium]|nr:nucleoside deaminase [Saprospiraceae bacterium]
MILVGTPVQSQTFSQNTKMHQPSDHDRTFLQVAYEQALQSFAAGGIPIGAALVHNGKLLGAGHNQRIQLGNPVLHGEMDALQNAGRLTARIYRQSTMYTTLSPCAMCAGAMLLYGIPRVVIGEHRSFMGEEGLLRSRGVEVVVLDDAECYALMQQFITASPGVWNEDI